MRFQFFTAALISAALGSPALSAGASTYQVLHDFRTAADGSNLASGVITGVGGRLYGVARGGGSSNDGLAYSLSPPKNGGEWREHVIHNFTGGADGAFPYTAFGVDAAGTLYGNVLAPAGSQGIVYSLTPSNGHGSAWTQATLFTFSGANGDGPEGAPVVGAGGALYGVTLFGGTTNQGVIFRLNPPTNPGGSWTATVLHDFAGSDGKFPQAGLTAGPNGVFYGTTTGGGSGAGGVVFQIAPPTDKSKMWKETVLHAFAGGSDGFNPFDAGVTVDPSGALIGATLQGGSFNQGVTYKLTPPAKHGGAWTETVLHTFGDGADGEEPLSRPVVAPDGTIYGTLSGGGIAGIGSVYALVPQNGGTYTYQNVHGFTGGADGGNPFGDLSIDQSGIIYGATGGDVNKGIGTVFSIKP